jgi:hypothetical protein
MSEFKTYKRVGEIEAREAEPADWPNKYDLRRISISPADWENGFTQGGMVARNPANHDDQWYIAPDYFAKHYAEIASGMDGRTGRTLSEEERGAMYRFSQTLLEIQHIKEVGPGWFTHGDDGMRRQFWLWIERGNSALTKLSALAKGGA